MKNIKKEKKDLKQLLFDKILSNKKLYKVGRLISKKELEINTELEDFSIRQLSDNNAVEKEYLQYILRRNNLQKKTCLVKKLNKTNYSSPKHIYRTIEMHKNKINALITLQSTPNRNKANKKLTNYLKTTNNFNKSRKLKLDHNIDIPPLHLISNYNEKLFTLTNTINSKKNKSFLNSNKSLKTSYKFYETQIKNNYKNRLKKLEKLKEFDNMTDESIKILNSMNKSIKTISENATINDYLNLKEDKNKELYSIEYKRDKNQTLKKNLYEIEKDRKVRGLFCNEYETLNDDIKKHDEKIGVQMHKLNKESQSNPYEAGNHIWLNVDTANIIRVGNAFHQMNDLHFYKNSKRLIEQYPTIHEDFEFEKYGKIKYKDFSLVFKNLNTMKNIKFESLKIFNNLTSKKTKIINILNANKEK